MADSRQLSLDLFYFSKLQFTFLGFLYFHIYDDEWILSTLCRLRDHLCFDLWLDDKMQRAIFFSSSIFDLHTTTSRY